MAAVRLVIKGEEGWRGRRRWLLLLIAISRPICASAPLDEAGITDVATQLSA